MNLHVSSAAAFAATNIACELSAEHSIITGVWRHDFATNKCVPGGTNVNGAEQASELSRLWCSVGCGAQLAEELDLKHLSCYDGRSVQ